MGLAVFVTEAPQAAMTIKHGTPAVEIRVKTPIHGAAFSTSYMDGMKGGEAGDTNQ